MNRLAREKRRLVMLQELTRDQADRVQWLTLELHQVPQTTMPAPKQMQELTPPEPEWKPRPVQMPTEPEEPETKPVEEIAQLLGLPPQQS